MKGGDDLYLREGGIDHRPSTIDHRSLIWTRWSSNGALHYMRWLGNSSQMKG